MTEAKTPNKHGATPAKLALIGVLFVALVFVVYRNFIRRSADLDSSAESDGDVAADAEAESPREKRATTPNSNSLEKLAARLRSRPWPNYLPAEVGDYDPFALPSAFPRPPETIVDEDVSTQSPDARAAEWAAKQAEAEAARTAAITAIRQQGVQAIFRNADEFVALIGDREVRVGDEVAGLIVVDIGTDGVALEGKKAK